MDELGDSSKKYEKVSVIYKSVMGWVSAFHGVCLALRAYHERMVEIDQKLTNSLTELSERRREEPHPQQQKKSKHVVR